jgi:glycerophosphoryl diester phosphodiesterase
VKSLDAGLPTGVLVSEDVWEEAHVEGVLERLIAQVKGLGCEWVNMDHKLFTAEMPERVHEHSLRLGVWTANSEQELRRLAAAGVDSLTSDRPDLFAHL